MADFVLYSYFRSSASYRVRCALHLKNISFEYRAVHLLKNGGEQHQDSYTKLNPAHEVPTLIHKEKVLGQSMAILEYLDHVAPQPLLFSKDPYQASLIRQVCETINCLQPLQNLRTLQFLTKELGQNETVKQQWAQHWITKGLDAVEQLLQKNTGPYCFGEQITAADCFLMPQLFASRRFEVKVENYKKISAIEQNLEKIEAFQKAHPSVQPDFQV